MAARRILIVDDEENIGRSLRLILEREGYAVNLCRSVAEFQTHPDVPRADAFMFDMKLPDGNGIDLLRTVRQNGFSSPVIMISGHGTIADAVEATRAGAFDFLEKPLSRDRVLLALKNALEHFNLRKENERLRELVGGAPSMIGASPAWARAVEQASLAARSDARVLLIGESGTGKELLAAHIHNSSPFAAGAFVKVNCAAIPTELLETELFGHEKGSFTGATGMRRGKFELADGGTIFLDEVGDLHGASQAKLLRVLQEGEFHRVGGEQIIKVSVRVISATNRDLSVMVAQEKFREDLYYRLSVVPIRVPALRERPQDIRPLAEYFLEDFCARNNFKSRALDPAVLPLLESYGWPGNARELRNVIERMAILSPGERLNKDSIPVEIRVQREAGPKSSVQEARESAEREHILRALEEAKWNVSGAARALGMERTNLHKRIRALGLSRENAR
ncbi:MAG TPA: sigma-54 dependent transcriptional regulator [Bryobacteraceae bacterium]|jgi:two-component system nitrogen regulation response regulator NtrX|nr:sigma-54 dependent transcriptional regulator [Bryobacteraceae bacterium]